MNFTLKSPRNRSVLQFLLWGVFVVVLYFQLRTKTNLQSLQQLLTDSNQRLNWNYILVALLLMPLNWYCETIKWRTFYGIKEHLQIRKSFQAIIAGVSLGFITPNRIGEYGARAFFVKRELRVQSLLATFYNSLAQNMVNVACGLLGLFLLQMYFVEKHEFAFSSIVLFATLFLFLLTAIYLRVERIISWSWIKRILGKVSPYFQKKIHQAKSKALMYNLGWSVIRYAVYMLQYILVAKGLLLDIDSTALFSIVAVQFLLQSLLPIPAIYGLFFSIEISLLLWSHFGQSELIVALLVFFVWFINLLLPALLGLIFMNRRISRYGKIDTP